MSLLSHIHFEFLTTKQWMGGWIDGIVGRLGPTGRSITIRRQLWAVRKSVVAVLLITHSYANKAKSSEMWWDDNKLSGSWRRLKSSKMIGSGESKIYNQRRQKHMIWLMLHTTITTDFFSSPIGRITKITILRWISAVKWRRIAFVAVVYVCEGEDFVQLVVAGNIKWNVIDNK